MTFVIRPIAEKDVAAVAELYRLSMTAAPYCREISPELAVTQIEFDMAAAEIFVAERENKIVGMISGFKFFDNAWLIWVLGLFVFPEEQGKGIGRALIEAMRVKFPECVYVQLLTHCDAPALGFYDSVGFEKSGYIHLIKR